MGRYFRVCVWAAVALSALLLLIVANGQTVTIKEINPTHSVTGGIGAATGGRVNHLGRATDRIFYAASEFGGLFKSTDAGRTWARLDTHLPNEMSSVKVSPANPDRVIATSIYDGRVSSIAGINVSSDGGATWRKPVSSSPPPGFCSLSTSAEPSAFGIAFDRENAAHVFVGTSCGLAKSTDGGLSWTFINPGPDSLATNVYGVVVHHGGIIDTCGLGGHRRSKDGGVSWDGAQDGGRPLPEGVCSIAASPDESSVLFATVGFNIFETDNGGGSWDTKFDNVRTTNREMFVTTNKREGRNFDLWFGYVQLFRAACRTPATPGPGARCPPSNTWTRATNGAHGDTSDLVFTNPPRFDAGACRQDCTSVSEGCQSKCADTRDRCMSMVGQPGGTIASRCAQDFANCRAGCTRRLNACNTDCARPRNQEGCPAVLSSDGGTYFNALTDSPACQTPRWTQPTITTRALHLWTLGGANIPNSLTREALYMGAQDNGAFATLDAGAATPTWTNPFGGDVFDMVSDSTQVVYTQFCCIAQPPGSRVFVRKPGLTGGGQIPNYPPGILPESKFPDAVARFGPNRYAMIMNDHVTFVSSGVYVTQDITRTHIVWTKLGDTLLDACALWAAGPSTNPTFYAVAQGSCAIGNGAASGSIFRYVGTSTTGSWQQVRLPLAINTSNTVSAFAVDPNNPNRLFVSQIVSGGARILRSSDGGANWIPDTVLDGLMTGGGTFRMKTSRYVQPSLLAFDPNDSNTLLAGAVDAGIFLSRDNGATWVALTNNSGNAANPVIPYPHMAYFDRECGQRNIYIGTRGRGAWRFSYHDPGGATVATCQSRCEVPFEDCQSKCDKQRADCMAETGPDKPLPFQCAAAFATCSAGCNKPRDVCRQRCVECPQ